MNRKILFLTTAMITGWAFTPAQAGFEWNPPPAKAAPAVTAGPSGSTADAVGGPLTPMPGEPAPIAKVEPVTEADIMDNGPQVAPVTATTQPGMRSIGNQPQELAGQNIESDLVLPVPGEMSPTPVAQSPVVMSQPAAIVEGFGKDIPLAVAMRQIVPPVYMVSYEPGVDEGKPMTWNGGSGWTSVVSDMLDARKLHATMSGNTITVSEGRGAALQMPVSQPAPVIADNSSITWDLGSKPVLNLKEQQHWTAKPGQGLRETLLNWSQQAKVELAWQNAKDMPIGSAFSFDGTFDQAVDALLSLYSGEPSEPKGKLYPNLPEGPSVLVIGSN